MKLPGSLGGDFNSSSVGSIASGNLSSLRSASSMRGLLLAEVGDSTVEFTNGGLGFREGDRITPESFTPIQPTRAMYDSGLGRQPTLISSFAPPGRNALELRCILGNSHMKLKTGAAVLPPSGQSLDKIGGIVTLEQAKTRARVELDVLLQGNNFVQGGYVNGEIEVRVRPNSKRESGIYIGEGKLRIIGFESISEGKDRHTFYQHGATFSEISDSSDQIYASFPDEDGYSQAKEGVSRFSFSMHLPMKGCEGTAKGALQLTSGTSVRYVVMVSLKVKDPDTKKRSISHFYRNCVVWPRLNPIEILSDSPEPIRATTSKTLFMGGKRAIELTATTHRLNWVAGQECFIKIKATNNTRKTIKSVTLTLLRSIMVFKSRPHLDTTPVDQDLGADPDACQTVTAEKQLAESTLEMGRFNASNSVGARGWWSGLAPGTYREFYHSILLPPDCLSITRGRLIEVSFSVRIALNTGVLNSNIQVCLPIQIVNFISLDPPPSYSLGQTTSMITHVKTQQLKMNVCGLFTNDIGESQSGVEPEHLNTLDEADELSNDEGLYEEFSSMSRTDIDNCSEDISDDDLQLLNGDDKEPKVKAPLFSDEGSTNELADWNTKAARRQEILSDADHVDSCDGIVQRLELVSSIPERTTFESPELGEEQVLPEPDQVNMRNDTEIVGGNKLGACLPQRPPLRRPAIEPGGPSSFARRVEEKLQAAARASERECYFSSDLTEQDASDSSRPDQFTEQLDYGAEAVAHKTKDSIIMDSDGPELEVGFTSISRYEPAQPPYEAPELASEPARPVLTLEPPDEVDLTPSRPSSTKSVKEKIRELEEKMKFESS